VRLRLPVLLTTAVLVCGFCEPVLRAQPQSQPNQLDANLTLFTVLSAINAAGYDAEVDSPSNHPLRKAVREAVRARKPASLERLKSLFEARRAWNWNAELSQYISYALSVEGPPDFKPRFPPNRMPPDTIALEGLSAVLAEFYREAGIEDLWRQSQGAFDQEIERYHAPVSKAIFDANMYLRNPTSGMAGRRFQVIVDLMGAPNQVHTRSFADDYFVVVTHGPRVRVEEIRHAYLHYLLDPLAIRYQQNLNPKRALGDLAHGSPLLNEAYKNDFVLLAGMSLVKAVEARIDRSLGVKHVDQAMREGFILAASFYEALAAYEKQEQSLRLYVPAMFDSIDVRREDARIAQVEFVSKEQQRAVKPKPAAAPPLSGMEKALEEAEALYEKRDLERARAAYQEVLREIPVPGAHAKAWFGLARIAALEKQPERALEFFEKTIESGAEPFERSWAHVYLARLALATTDPDPDVARRHYQAALAVEGASDGARKAAQTELARLQP
jgi:tetratricopeptide (TPR) repeat protein